MLETVYCNETLSTELVHLKQKEAVVLGAHLLLCSSAKFLGLKVVHCEFRKYFPGSARKICMCAGESDCWLRNTVYT